MKTILDHQAKLQAYEGKSLIMHTRFYDLVDVENAYDLHKWTGETSDFVFLNEEITIACLGAMKMSI